MFPFFCGSQTEHTLNLISYLILASQMILVCSESLIFVNLNLVLIFNEIGHGKL